MKQKLYQKEFNSLYNKTASLGSPRKHVPSFRSPSQSTISAKKHHFREESTVFSNSITYNNIRPSTGQNSHFRKAFQTLEKEENCPGGSKCENYSLIKRLKKIIRKLILSNENLSQVNEYFSFLLSQKDEMYQNVLEENGKMKFDVNSYKNMRRMRKEQNINLSACSFSMKKQDSLKPVALTIPTVPTKKKPPKKIETLASTLSSEDEESEVKVIHKSRKTIVSFKEGSKISSELMDPLSAKHFRKKTNSVFCAPTKPFSLPVQEPSVKQEGSKEKMLLQVNGENPDSSLNFYNKLKKMSLKNKYKTCATNISFLATSPEKLFEMLSNPLLKELTANAQQEDHFLKYLNGCSHQKIELYCDVITSVSREYQELIKLIARIQDFLKSSLSLVDSVLLQDSTMVLIANTCNILNCERASLFIYDRESDKLILGTSKGLKKNEIKVPKDKGIVGAVFMSGERLKIDDVYLDARFNKEVDKKTNYRTRNMLCFPLKDKDGETFGAIQAINKKTGPFDVDDLELMEIFSQQAASILKNMMNIDENSSLISKIKQLVDFSNSLIPIKTKYELTDKCNEIIESLFYSTSIQVLFYNKNKGVLEKYVEKEIEEVKLLGILREVFKKKEMHGCSSIKQCTLYNSLVDLPSTESLITFPILNSDQNVIAIVQFVFPGRLSEISQKPKESEMIIIDIFVKCFVTWYINNVSSK